MSIAVIGMAARFPGAEDVAAFWANLLAGRHSMHPVTDDECLAAGGNPADPRLVKMASTIDRIDQFDAGFFRYSDEDAALLDPQQRLFLECAHHAMENAGQVASGDVVGGIYAATNFSRYWTGYVYPELGMDTLALYGNLPDSLAARVAYHLDFTGPVVGVQAACSSVFVAVHQACQDLLNYQCDLALAGGVSVDPWAGRGYLHVPGGPGSSDGFCRAFDASADGSIAASGLGVVVLKRLADAVADRDHVHAVITGSAVRNDGRNKVGTAGFSPVGIMAAAADAHAAADVPADTIGYLEPSATGRPTSDAIELSALGKVFRASTDRVGCCAIGSVKSNIGNLATAAGAAALIKTVLAVEHGLIPPTLHYRSPHPLLELADSPFTVNTALSTWDSGRRPRRAAVCGSGLGGTHGHLVLEQPPDPVATPVDDRWMLVPISAHTPEALETLGNRLSEHLGAHPDVNLADVAYTLRVGRRALPHRRFAVCRGGVPFSWTTPSGAPERLVEAGQAWVDGRTVRWDQPDDHGRRTPLPEYPFQRGSHWITPTDAARVG